MRKVETRDVRGRRHRLLAHRPTLAGFALALLGSVAFAVPAGAAGASKAKLKDVTVCPSDPKAGCLAEPSPDTPVPAVYQASYKVYLDMKAKAHGGTTYTDATIPDWSGFWSRIGAINKFDPLQPGPASEGRITADLTPRGLAVYRHRLSEIAAGREWDTMTMCLPYGFPRGVTGGFQREIVTTPKETYVIIEPNSEVRRIYTDGRGHIPEDEAYPLWDGDDIGFWDGDTLVSHTIYVHTNMFERSQPDYSSKVSAVERLRKDGPNSMVSDIVVWDPEMLVHPWHVINHYRRISSPYNRLDLAPCSENLNTVRAANGGTHLILPGEPGYVNPDDITRDPAAVLVEKEMKAK